MLEGVPDGSAPVLVPRFTLADGTQLMPLAFIRDVRVVDSGVVTTVTYRQAELDRMGKNAPVADDRIAATPTYKLEPDRITRTDVFTPKAPLDVGEITLEYAGFSRDPQQNGRTTRFGSGTVTAFNVDGLEACTSRPLNHDHAYESDTGPMTALVACTTGPSRVDHAMTIRWSLEFR